MKTIHETLIEGLRRIDRYGWRNEAACDPEDGYCARLALVGIEGGDEFGATNALGRAAGLGATTSSDSLYRWNDASDEATVRATYLKAIAATAPSPDLTHVIGDRIARESLCAA